MNFHEVWDSFRRESTKIKFTLSLSRGIVNQISLESGTKEGNSPVGENSFMLLVIILKYGEARQPCRKPAGLLCQG